MQKILMILTSHRLDCFQLCVDMLVRGGSAKRFDRIVILCSGVEGRHLDYVQSLPRIHPGIGWDFIFGARGRGKPISDMQNDCVRRYPDALYFKLDEDTFVSGDWDVEIEKAYRQFKDDTNLSLLTAVVTNNQRGAYHLLNVFQELGEEFKRRFNQPIVKERMGPIWILPQCAAFMIRRFLNLEASNQELRAKNQQAKVDGRWTKDEGQWTKDARRRTKDEGQWAMDEKRRSEVGGQNSEVRGQELDVENQGAGEPTRQSIHQTPNPESRIPNPISHIPPPEAPSTKHQAPTHPAPRTPHPESCITFSYPFSINCICYDYRHWQEIGGVPEEDENGWGKWIPENGKFIVLVTDALVHHYSFFVQQAWLDRTSLLEDIRRENVPETYHSIPGWMARTRRIMQQVPGALMRRLGKK